MTTNRASGGGSILTLYNAITAIGFLSLLFLGASGLLGKDLVSKSIRPKFEFHPTTFVLFVLMFSLTSMRLNLGSSYFRKSVWNYIAWVTTGLLVILTFLRGYELVAHAHVAWVVPILGENGVGNYVSFWTLAAITAFHALVVHRPHSPPMLLRWLSYAIFFTTVLICLHQLSDIILGNEHYYLDSVSAISNAWLVAFGAFIFPHIGVNALLFDPRAPKANIISAATLIAAIGILSFLEAYAPYPGLSLALAGAMLLALPILISVFRPLEISVRMAQGEIREDGTSTAFVPAPRNWNVQQNIAPNLNAFERKIRSSLFEKRGLQRYVVQAIITFVLAYGAFVLGRTEEPGIVALWWANTYLAFNVFIEKDGNYLNIFFAFALSLLAANILAETEAVASVFFIILHLMEGALMGFLARAVFRVNSTARTFSVSNNLTIPQCLMAASLALSIMAVTSFMGSILISLTTDAGVFENIPLWFLGSAMGTFGLMPLFLGIVLEVWLGYRKLTPKIPYLAPLCLAYALGVFCFYAFAPTTSPLPVPFMVFILTSIPLVILPSLQLVGALQAFNTTVLHTLYLERWPGDEPIIQLYFVMTLVPTIVMFSMVARYNFSRFHIAEQRALEFAPNALITLDEDWRVINISKNANEWFEMSAKALVGKRFLDYFENAQELLVNLKDVLIDDANVVSRTIAKRRLSTGQTLIFAGTISGNQDPSLPYAYVLSLSDITKEQELELERAQSAEVVNSFLNSGYTYFQIEDENHNTIAASKGFVCDFLGSTTIEVVGKDVASLSGEDPKVIDERRRFVSESLKHNTNIAYNYSRHLRGKDGLRHLRSKVTRIDRNDGKYWKVIVTEDITDWEQARAEADALLSAGTAAYFISNDKFEIVLLSQGLCDLVGYEAIEDYADITNVFIDLDQNAVARARKEFAKVPTGEIWSSDGIHRLRTKSGEIRFVRASRRWFKTAGLPGRRLWTSIEDVTALEAARFTAENYLKAGLNTYTIVDENFNIVYASDAALSAFEAETMFDIPLAHRLYVDYSSADMLGHSRHLIKLPTGEVFRTEEPIRIFTAKGNIRLVIRSQRWFMNFDGNSRLLLTQFEDVTELENKKLALEALLRERDRLAAATSAYLDAGTNLFSVQDEHFNFLHMSEPLLELFGIKDISELADSGVLREVQGENETQIVVRNALSRLETGQIYYDTVPLKVTNVAGRKLIFKNVYRWFDNPLTEGRLLMRGFTEITDLLAARSFNEALLDNSPAIILTEDQDGKLLSCSEAWVRRMGYSRKETLGRELVDFFVPEQHDSMRAMREKFSHGAIDDYNFAADLLNNQGSVLHLRINARADLSSGSWRVILTLTDVTELEQHRRYTDTLLDSNSSIMLTQDAQWKILSCSEAWVQQLGYSRDETLGHDLIEFLHPEDAETDRIFRSTLLMPHRSEKVIKNTLRFLTKAGETRTVEMQSVVVLIEEAWLNILTLVDITEIMETQRQLSYMVNHDELTGLLSRRGMQQRFANTSRSETLSVYVLDIDHFKSVNDSFSHAAGDELLRAFGRTMSKLTKDDGSAIRLGGEEFAVIRPWHGWEEATRFGETLLHALAKTKVLWNSREISRTASIGFAPLHETDQFSDVLHIADLVAREVKIRGRNQVLGATEAIMTKLRNRGVFIRGDEIQAALENGEIRYDVQPIWNMELSTIEGFEALIRWVKPDGTRLLPGLFIELLHEVIREPRYLRLKDQLRRDCLANLTAFPTQYVSFNFTLEQLGYDGAARDLIEMLESVKDHVEREIVIEVSERAMTARVDDAILRKEMDALHRAGYRIALDDFGVESSNLNRLQQFPISIVKIDRALISRIEKSKTQRATLRGLTLTLTTLGIKIIVEGVEQEEQAEALLNAGIQSQQGYLHARPMPPQDLEKNLANLGNSVIRRHLWDI